MLLFGGVWAGANSPDTIRRSPDPPATAQPPVNLVLASVDATGGRDVTAELQAFIDGVPDGGIARLAKGGSYRIEGTLLLSERHDLRIDGNGSRLFATTTGGPDRTHLRVVGGSGLVIYDVEIAGANPHAGLDDRAYQVDLVGQHGIRLEGTTDLELARVQVSDIFGDFVYVGRSTDGRWTERLWIHDSVFTRSGRQGIAVTAGRDVVIENNTITDTRRATVDLEPNGASWGAENIHILNNQVGAGRLLFLAAAGAGPVDRVVVAGNELRGHILNTVVVPPSDVRRNTFYFVDNTSDTPATRAPLRFTRIDGVVVRGNTQPVVRPGEAGVDADGVCGLVVTGNDLSPGNRQVSRTAGGCGTPPVANPPEPPAVAGRPVSGAVIATTTTTTTTAPPPRRGAPEDPDSGVGSGRAGRIALGGAMVVGLVLAAWAALSATRARRQAGRRRFSRSPRH